MASNTVRVNVVGDSSQLQTAFNKGASSADRFKAQMGLVAKAAVAALAIKALGAVKDFVGDSVRAFSDLNESLNAVEVTFGKNAEGIKKLGEGAAQNLGLSNAEFNSFAVQMSAFAHEIAGDGGDVVGVVDELSTRVADFASVMNLDVAEAARLFQSGLAGETEPLRRYGIDVSAAAVKNHALAEGISDGTGELTEQEKVLARHSLLMEQTDKVQGDFKNTIDDYANSQRVANAEMENAKALIGQNLEPVAQLTTQLKSGLSQALGLVAGKLLEVTGQLSSTDEAISRFRILTGEAADTATSAATIVKEYGESFTDLLPRLSLSREELEKLQGVEETLMEQHGFSEEQVSDLADAVEDELVKARYADRDAALQSRPEINKWGNAQEEAAEKTEEATDAIQEQIDKLRGMADPLFGAFQALEDLEQAQRDYKTAVDESDLEGQEDAIQDIVEANIDLREKYQELKAQGIDPASEAGRNAFRDMGLTTAQIDTILGQFQRLEDNAPNIKVRVEVPTMHARTTSDSIRWDRGKPQVFAKGGIVTGPTNALIGEAGSDEAVVPLNGQGVKILGAALREAMGGMGGGQPIYVTVNALDPQSAATAVVQALQTYNRLSGAVPITVRQ